MFQVKQNHLLYVMLMKLSSSVQELCVLLLTVHSMTQFNFGEII